MNPGESIIEGIKLREGDIYYLNSDTIFCNNGIQSFTLDEWMKLK